jgi:hypothetical protein
MRTASNASRVVAQSALSIMQPRKGDFTANITILSSSRRLGITAGSIIPIALKPTSGNASMDF